MLTGRDAHRHKHAGSWTHPSRPECVRRPTTALHMRHPAVRTGRGGLSRIVSGMKAGSQLVLSQSSEVKFSGPSCAIWPLLMGRLPTPCPTVPVQSKACTNTCSRAEAAPPPSPSLSPVTSVSSCSRSSASNAASPAIAAAWRRKHRDNGAVPAYASRKKISFTPTPSAWSRCRGAVWPTSACRLRCLNSRIRSL